MLEKTVKNTTNSQKNQTNGCSNKLTRTSHLRQKLPNTNRLLWIHCAKYLSEKVHFARDGGRKENKMSCNKVDGLSYSNKGCTEDQAKNRLSWEKKKYSHGR